MSNFKETMGNVRKTGVNICPYFLKYFRERFSNFDDLGKGFWGREAPPKTLPQFLLKNGRKRWKFHNFSEKRRGKI